MALDLRRGAFAPRQQLLLIIFALLSRHNSMEITSLKVDYLRSRFFPPLKLHIRPRKRRQKAPQQIVRTPFKIYKIFTGSLSASERASAERRNLNHFSVLLWWRRRGGAKAKKGLRSTPSGTISLASIVFWWIRMAFKLHLSCAGVLKLSAEFRDILCCLMKLPLKWIEDELAANSICILMCASSTLFARRSALIQFLHQAGALFQFPPEEIALKLNHKKKLRVPISAGRERVCGMQITRRWSGSATLVRRLTHYSISNHNW